MKVWVMRHGDAPYIDGERRLSERGKLEVSAMGQRLAALLEQQQLSLQAMLVSPYLRAQQTADLVEQELTAAGHRQWLREQEPLLRSESDPDMTASYVESLPHSSVLLVSHMPLVANLLATWIPGHRQHFPTAAIAELELVGERMRLVDFYRPE